jgi:hypothetical protein
MSCRWVLPARSILGRTGTSSSVRACGHFSMGGYARAAPPGASASARGWNTTRAAENSALICASGRKMDVRPEVGPIHDEVEG